MFKKYYCVKANNIFSGFPLPAIAHVVIDKTLLRYVVIHKISEKEILIADSGKGCFLKLLKPFLDENKERLELMFLPPYNSEFNLLEGAWRWLNHQL